MLNLSSPLGLLDNSTWLKPRVKSRTFYKRVILTFLKPPSLFTRSPMRVLVYDGKYWVEVSFNHNAVQTRVVRDGYPRRHTFNSLANENTNLGVELVNDGFHVVELKVHNRMATPLTGRVKSGAIVVCVLYILSMIVSGLSLLVQAPLFGLAVALSYIILRGGIGNTGVAKQVVGITSPFIVTPYMLVKHIESRKELLQDVDA